jgi:hypothetical protein
MFVLFCDFPESVEANGPRMIPSQFNVKPDFVCNIIYAVDQAVLNNTKFAITILPNTEPRRNKYICLRTVQFCQMNAEIGHAWGRTQIKRLKTHADGSTSYGSEAGNL